jgi:hypothetical protein
MDYVSDIFHVTRFAKVFLMSETKEMSRRGEYQEGVAKGSILSCQAIFLGSPSGIS